MPEGAGTALTPEFSFVGRDFLPDSDSMPQKVASAVDPSRNQLRRVNFFQDDDAIIGVVLETSREPAWRLAPARPGQIRIVLPDLVSPPALTKLHQLHGFAHPVKSALLRNTVEGLELLLTATSPVAIESDTLPERVVLRFVDETQPEPPARGPAPAVPTPPGQQRGALQPDMAAGATPAREETLFPGMREEYVGEPISIDLQNAEVEHVLRLIGEVAGYNLILDSGVGGRISMKLDNVPWDQVLDLVLVQRNLGMVVRGNILRISPIQQLEAEREQLRRAREAALQAEETIQRLEPLQTSYIQINYATAAEMDVRTRPFLSERGRLNFDPRTNTLIVTDTPSQIRQIQGMVNRLDRPERQVLIEARVVYATDDFQRGLGVQWGGGIEGVTTEYYRGVYGTLGGLDVPGAGVAQTGYLVNTPMAAGTPTFGIGGFISKLMGPDMFTLDVQLQLAELKNTAQTISSPRVVTLNNQRAQIEQGTRLAIQVPDERGTRTDYVDAVLMLSVLPQITPDNKLILDLEIRDDNPVGNDIDTKTTRTRLMVDNGQTLVLGGVLKSSEDRLENRVPGFADLPGLGWLFKSRADRSRSQELLIFIRPSIL
ncbi:hypothetical protein JCM31598_22840 [Desulfonatronum parangueonense]